MNAMGMLRIETRNTEDFEQFPLELLFRGISEHYKLLFLKPLIFQSFVK